MHVTNLAIFLIGYQAYELLMSLRMNNVKLRNYDGIIFFSEGNVDMIFILL